MPELPEVEAARRATEEHCCGKKVKRCVVADDPKVIDGVSPSEFQKSLIGKTIVAAHRKGKNMWLQLDSPPFPSFQFGMSGAVSIKGIAVTKYRRSAVNDADEWPSKYSKVFMELDDGLEWSFTDKRRFAKVRLLQDPTSVPPISELGPDALLEPMSENEFFDSLKKKKIVIKTLLLDQGFIAGIGNWVADEVLYHAKIHPLQTASSLSKDNCETLLKCINEVIEKALKVGADSSQFPSNWIFHSREKKPGKAFVNGKKIDFITVGGRTSAYVPELQKLTGASSSKVVSKRKKGSAKNGDEENPASDEESDKEIAQSKKKKTGTSGKLDPSAKAKTESSHEDEDDDDEDDDDDDGGRKRKKPKTTKQKKEAAVKKTLQKGLKASKSGVEPKKKTKK